MFSFKNYLPCRDLNPDLPSTKPMHYQLSYPGLDSKPKILKTSLIKVLELKWRSSHFENLNILIAKYQQLHCVSIYYCQSMMQFLCCDQIPWRSINKTSAFDAIQLKNYNFVFYTKGLTFWLLVTSKMCLIGVEHCQNKEMCAKCVFKCHLATTLGQIQ